MRHRVKGKGLSRTAAHRKATFRALTKALVKEHRIVTTVTKAKEFRRFVEPLITRSKEDTTHNRRIVFRALRNKYEVTELFRIVSEKVGNSPGGQTRIITLGNRLGDNADMALIELVDFNDVYTNKEEETKKTTRRSRAKKSADAPTVEASEEAPAVDASEKDDSTQE